MIDMVMIQKGLSTFGSSCWTRGIACLIVVLCICVVAQVLGVPATLIGLLNADVLTKSEPISEDFSTLSTLPESGKLHLLSMVAEVYPVPQFPVLAISIFRPPSA